MDYYKIGQQIRKLRKAHGFSQEELAEKVDISVTHMSHIETGNTKLSLPVFLDIAQVLEVSTDELLGESGHESNSKALSEIAAVLECCSAKQVKVIAEIVKSAKISMDKYF